MIKKNEFLEETLAREQAKRELISDCETRFASWIYRFLCAHQELLISGEYRFLYQTARDLLIRANFEELNQANVVDFEKVGACFDLATDCMHKDDLLISDQYAPLVNWLAMLLDKYKNSRYCH